MFQFKQFTIQQDRTPMKVGTDGVLLGAWADLEKADRLLDVGTGTGLIALMSAQRNPTVVVDALEIESNACRQAQENIQESEWAQRIQVIPVALQAYFPAYQYDCIVCNPPFFINSTKPPDNGRTLARHCDTLSHQELVEHAARLLKPTGCFCVILPPSEADQMIRLANKYELFPEHITYVLPNPDKSPKRYLIKFVFGSVSTLKDELVVELNRHQYSEEYIRLTRAFYLHFE
ncbi:MAG: methyltransferase [Odoribacter sp.]